MTSRQLYEAVLIELNKENAPNILLEDFNYFANKAINNYINKRYNIYDINQQTTDDLRVLKATAVLKPKHVNDYNRLLTTVDSGVMATYEVIMPSDYLHILNCICIYKVKETYRCYNKNTSWRCPATRLTADMYSLVLDNFFNKPSYKKPYYYIHNVNTSKDTKSSEVITHASLPTNSNTDANPSSIGNDGNSKPIKTVGKGNSKGLTINIGGEDSSNVERGAGIRYGNVSEVRLEIRYGTDTEVFELTDVLVDYIKAPQNIRLTQQEIDKTQDISQMLEYPDYVCQEIVNELVHLVMENISDLRLQTHPVVTLSIANPAQALAPQAQGLSAQ